LLRNRRFGISPVVATIVLIAIAVAVSLAVAFWAGGLTGVFTRFEKIEALRCDVVLDSSGGSRDYRVIFLWKNAGTADTTIVDILLNDRPVKVFWPSAEVYLNGEVWVSGSDSSFRGVSFPSGSVVNIEILFPSNGSTSAFSPGQTIEVKVVTAYGVYYVKNLVVP